MIIDVVRRKYWKNLYLKGVKFIRIDTNFILRKFLKNLLEHYVGIHLS